MDDIRLTALQALVEPIVAEHEAEVVELTCRPWGRQVVVRLLVDKVGGITIQQCARLNQRIGQVLEAAHLMDEDYTIEVSSPGLDRPLVTKRDFERTVGEELTLDVRIDEGRFGQLQGMLLAIQPEAVVINTPSGNVTVPFADIRAAKKALKW